MDNQYCIIPIGRLEDIEVDIIGVKTYENFEVINIMGDKDPYLALLGIDWDIEDYVVIDLKREIMTFEVDEVRVIQPLNPYQGPIFTKPVDDRKESSLPDQIYRLTTRKREDYINPIFDGSISWRRIQRIEVSSKVVWDDWQQGDHKLHARRCETIHYSCWTGTKVWNYPTFNDMGYAIDFITEIDLEDEETQNIPFLGISLQETPTRWWGSHRKQFQGWEFVKAALLSCFGGPREYSTSVPKYVGHTDPHKYIHNCRTEWTKEGIPESLWVHQFNHILGTFPQAWYVREEMRRQIMAWELMLAQFSKDLSFFH